jgi:sugar lactone lactonase YvrE
MLHHHIRSVSLPLLSALFPFTAVAASRQDAPAGLSDTAFVLARAGVIPENIVYDAPRNRFLGGDLEKDGMIEIGREGSVRPFAGAAGLDGRVLGLRIDTGRNLLWGVAFTRLPQPAGDTTQAPARSILFALQLPGGRLVRRIDSPKDGSSHLFNDLVLGREGTVYFTDSEAGAVWTLAPNATKLRLLHRAPPERFAYPNGIAFQPGQRGLVVAHWQGLVTIALPSGTVTPVRAANDSVVGRIDGLYSTCRGYLGIQNMANPSRLISFQIEEGAARDVRELERGRADFRGPTTGAIVGDTLFYVANAQIGPFDPRREGGALAPVLILKRPLGCEG